MGIPSLRQLRTHKKLKMMILTITLLVVVGGGYGSGLRFADTRVPTQKIPSTCLTQQGTTCIFPFTYKGVTYDKCTFADSPQDAWCATGVDTLGNVITNMWQNCDLTSGCQTEATGGSGSTGGSTGTSGGSSTGSTGSTGGSSTGSTGSTGTSCSTTSGPDSSKSCVFPFMYNNVMYSQCTDVQLGSPWCSTEVDADGNFVL